MPKPVDRAQFLNMAGIFEGSLVFLAMGLAWIFSLDLVPQLEIRPAGVLVGLLAALPPLGLFVASERLQWAPLKRIKRLIEETLGQPLLACRWYDLILLAALAGIGEELLFRGVIQALFERWSPAAADPRLVGLIASNVIFGVLHLITPLYAVLAAAMGVYFGWLLDATGSRNLIAPMIAHGLYDYLAFLVLIRDLRKQPSEPSVPNEQSTDAPPPV